MNTRRVGTIAMVALLVTSAFAGFAGTTLAQESSTQYWVEHNGQCTAVQSFGDGSTTVDEFYDYRTPEIVTNETTGEREVNDETFPQNDYSSFGTEEYQKSQYTRLMVYEGSDGMSLVIVNDDGDDGVDGAAGSGEVTLTMSENSLEWAVEDDEYDEPLYGGTPDDEFTETGAYWKWADGRTDGGALSGLESTDSVTFTFEQNESMQGVEFLTETSGDDYGAVDVDGEFTLHRSETNPCESAEEPTTTPDEGDDTTTTPDEGDDEQTTTPDETETPSETTRSSPDAKAVSAQQVSATASSAQIVPPPNGGTVTFALPSERTNGVKFQDARVGVTSKSLSFQMTSSLSAEAPNGTSAPDMPTWAYLTTGTEGSNADVTTADVTFTVTEEALDGASADDVSVMYYADGAWEQAETNVTSEGEGMYTLTTTAPADTTLAVGLSGDGAGSTDGGNASEGNETTGNETTTSDEETTTDDGAAQEGETETQSESGGESGTTTNDGAAQEGETETQSESGGESGDTGTTSGSAPGFGLLLTVLAVAGSALLLARRR